MNSLLFRINRRLRYEYLRRFDNPATLVTKMGVYRVPIGVKDPISRKLFLHGEFELDLIKDAMEVVRKISNLPKGKGTVLDIGANNGVISIGMLVTGQVERAVAIEPEPTNFARMEENVKLNKLENKILRINCALSDQKADLEFELSDSNFGDHRVRTTTGSFDMKEIFKESERAVITVPADKLDVLISKIPPKFADEFAVVWIDVQGYEGYVFKGARGLLARSMPVVSEIWPYGIARAGMSMEEFSELVSGLWSSFWVRRSSRINPANFVRYPIAAFKLFLDELGVDGGYDNVIFANE